MLICKRCNVEFLPQQSCKTQHYCNWNCYRQSVKKPDRYCQECNCLLTGRWKIKFCGRSCATTYNNKNKKTGSRRSKLELYIEEVLSKQFSSEEVLFNDKNTIGSELDIYFPKLKLAFELNGPFHYRPIYGEEKFNRIKKMDEQKKSLCKAKGIELVSIDTQNQLQFTEQSSIIYVEAITRRMAERPKAPVY